jgi:hypothetical protein
MGGIMSLEQILTKKRFSKLVETKVEEKNMSYMDAVIDVCTDRELDPGEINNLIGPILKDKIEAEAVSLRLMKSNGNQLPI